MTDVLERIHIWVGLFNLSALVVFALTGLWATLPRLDMPASPESETVAYDPPPAFDDLQIARDLFDRLTLPLAAPVPDWAVHRNDQNVLVLHFSSVRGAYEVTLDEAAKTVTVVRPQNSLGEFLDAVHGTTLYAAAPDLRVRLWAAYVDFSIFSLLFMSATGVWLWLSSRPRLWWAWLSFTAGTGLFAVLWFAAR